MPLGHQGAGETLHGDLRADGLDEQGKKAYLIENLRKRPEKEVKLRHFQGDFSRCQGKKEEVQCKKASICQPLGNEKRPFRALLSISEPR